jgi:hypothetical protein
MRSFVAVLTALFAAAPAVAAPPRGGVPRAGAPDPAAASGVPAAMPSAGAPVAVTASARAAVKVVACTEGLDLAQRSVTFEGRMRPIPGTVTMALRFVLQAQTPGDPRWRHVTADGFDRWLSSAPGVRRYTYAKTVRSLLAPASYRTTVRFRWLDANGRLLDQDDAVSAVCAQDDLRPDLVPRRIDDQPPAAGPQRGYGVLVRNTGGSASGAFAVRVDVPGAPSATVTTAALGPGESRVVTVTAAACAPGDTVNAVVDATALVDEADEDGNVLSVACPD